MERVRAFGRHFGLCVLAPDDVAARLERELGYAPASSTHFATQLAERCVALVRANHLAGEEARACIAERGERVRTAARELPLPGLPRGWIDAGLDGSSAHYRSLRARRRDPRVLRELAAIEIASTDFSGALRTLRHAPADYEVEVLRAIAEYGADERGFRLREIEAALLALAAREPSRGEAHLAHATLVSQHWHMRARAELDRALDSARAYACMIDPAEPDASNRATTLMMGVLYGIEQIDRGYTSPFRYYGDGPPPALPLPLDRLGPDAQARFREYTMPVESTCAEVFARLGIPPLPAR